MGNLKKNNIPILLTSDYNNKSNHRLFIHLSIPFLHEMIHTEELQQFKTESMELRSR